AGQVLGLDAGTADQLAVGLGHHRTHAAAAGNQELALSVEVGLDLGFLPGLAVIDVAHHLRILDELADEYLPVLRPPGPDEDARTLHFEALGLAHRIRGSGSSRMPKRPCTESRMRVASAQICAPVAWPQLMSTSECRSDTAASPSRTPLKPQVSMSHAADTFTLPSAAGQFGSLGWAATSAWARSASSSGFLKKLPALPVMAGSGSLRRRSVSTACATSKGCGCLTPMASSSSRTPA